jgi:serine/threonine-protein kinase
MLPAQVQGLAPQDGLLGRTLAGTYVVSRLIGQGGMGSVYVARHERTGRLVALKVLFLEMARNARTFHRFVDEARIASALDHPGIVRTFDFHTEPDGTSFLVMELLEGEDLQARLDRTRTLPLPEALNMARQVGGALHAAHQHGVVHRDVKPSNIFLARKTTAQGVVEVARVLDFGICKIRDGVRRITQEMSVLGTPDYMSPEAALGNHEGLDGRADQFSLAVILYQALSGRPPWAVPGDDSLMGVMYRVIHEPPPPLVVPGLPEHVVSAIARAMQKRKEDRFPTMADFVSALEGVSWAGASPEEATRAVALPPPSIEVAAPWSVPSAAPDAQTAHISCPSLGWNGQIALPPPPPRPRRSPTLLLVGLGAVGVGLSVAIWFLGGALLTAPAGKDGRPAAAEATPAAAEATPAALSAPVPPAAPAPPENAAPPPAAPDVTPATKPQAPAAAPETRAAGNHPTRPGRKRPARRLSLVPNL